MKEQEREKIKAMNLHGKELFEYCCWKSSDRELSNIAMILLLDGVNREKIGEYLERIIYNNEVVISYDFLDIETAEDEVKAKAKIKGKECIGGGEDFLLYL